MKKLMMILMIAIGVSSVDFGQTKMSNDPKLKHRSSRSKKRAGKHGKIRIPRGFKQILADDNLIISSAGVRIKRNMKKTFRSATSKGFARQFQVRDAEQRRSINDIYGNAGWRVLRAKNSVTGSRNCQLCQARRQMARSDVYGNADVRTKRRDAE